MKNDWLQIARYPKEMAEICEKQIVLSYPEILLLLSALAEERVDVQLNYKKHKIYLLDSVGNKIWDVRLPLPLPSLKGCDTVKEYVQILSEEIPRYYIILIRAGNCALAYCEDGEIEVHNVIRKYMVRKKQGKAQITYLNKKGKSRYGSRLRLAGTRDFFKEINEKLQEWSRISEVEKILFSAPEKLWGMLYGTKKSPPFDSKDARLIKIPLDVNQPNLAELERVNNFALNGIVAPVKQSLGQ